MDIGNFIKGLKSSSIVAQCALCGEEFALSDALIFDGMAKFPEPAEEKRLLLVNQLKEMENALKKRKISADIMAEKKAIEVGFGKLIEKFLPAYKDLRLQFRECRPLYDPIDVIVFNGLLTGKVDMITFLEIKSGDSRLNAHQKLIKKAVLDGKVNLKVL